MKIFYLFSIGFFVISLTGCGQKTTALNHFKKDPMTAASIQYTKKRDIVHNNEPKAMLFATYLNNIDEKYESDKLNSFVIGIHLVNSDNHQLKENQFNLFMNDNEPKNMVELDENSKYLNHIPLKNPWANYYLVHFDNNEKIYKLNIKLTHPVFGQTSLSFDK